MIDRMIICLFCTTMKKDDILYSLRALIKQVMPAGTKVFCLVRKPVEMSMMNRIGIF